ncbi:MAG: hypothetical protein JHC57_22290, partial [Sphingopyxis sp.]|uniref:hypothetical protein n=1 Tax=Sphingopyxis sp. TaxID=1908224 RepID=UPI001A1EF20B
MAKSLKRPLSIAFGALATTMLGGCYYGDVYGASYASGGDCAARYGDAYYDYDGYAYDDGYGYDCYDGADYGSGFAQIGFGGGWYDDYYYPGYGMWMFDNYRNRYPLRGQYLNYWGGRRAWWKHHGGRKDWKPGRPGGWNSGDHDDRPGDGRPGRPGGWHRGDRDNDGPRGTRPGRGDDATGTPPATGTPGRPGRPDWGAGRPRPVPQEGTAGRPRPIRNMPATEPGETFVTPRGDRGGARPPRTRPAPSALPGRAPRAERPAPAYRPPAPQSQPA